MGSGRPEPSFEDEVLRINARYNREIVEALHVCPFARGARVGGTSVRRVVLGETLVMAAMVSVIEELEREAAVEVAQVIFPRVVLDARAFQEFASDLGPVNAARHAPARPIFVHAAFHPDLPYFSDTPPRLVPFFRRSPDPMIQLVRLCTLDAVHADKPRGTQFFGGDPGMVLALLAERPESVTDRITRENHAAAIEGGGLARIGAIFGDILEDRRASYARYSA